MTSKFNGKRKFRPPVDLKPLNILKPKLNHRSLYNRANFRRNRSKRVCFQNRWNISDLWLSAPFLPFSFLSFPFSCRLQQTNGRIYTIYTSNDADSPNDVPFGGFNNKNIVQGIKNLIKHLQKWARLGNFKPKVRKIEVAILFKTIRQINTKFDKTLKTTRATSWVVRETAYQNLRWRTAVTKKLNCHNSSSVQDKHDVSFCCEVLGVGRSNR